MTLQQARERFGLDRRMIYRAAELGLVRAYQDQERPKSHARYAENELAELARLLQEEPADEAA